MEIKTKLHNKTLYILLSGELDEHAATNARANLDMLFETVNGFNQVVMDLSELEFMDSTGIGVLIGRYKKLKSYNKPIFITNPSIQAEKIFKLSGLYQIIPKIS